MNDMNFYAVMMKKNRDSRNEEKKREREEEDFFWTKHLTKRMRQRRISENYIEACLKKGKRKMTKTAIFYVLGKLNVVVDKQNETVLTAYYDS